MQWLTEDQRRRDDRRRIACANQRTFDLPLGALLALDHGWPHDVEAIEDSAFLLTLPRPRCPGRYRLSGSPR